MLALCLCLNDTASSWVHPAVSGEQRVLCVTGSPSAQLQPLYIEHTSLSSSVTVTPLEPVQLSMDDSPSSTSVSSTSSSHPSVHRGVNSLEWSVDRQLLATAGWDGRVRLFSVTQARSDPPDAAIRLLAVMRFHTAAAQTIAWAPSQDAATASSSDSATFPLAAPATLSSFSRLSSVSASARSLLASAASPQSTLLASGADDQRIALYALPVP